MGENAEYALTLMRDRRSVRAFLKTPVAPDTLNRILDNARFAPSGVNTQPWQVAIVGSHHQQKIAAAIIAAREQQLPENPDYSYYPAPWFEPYKSRRKACGLALYGAVNIKVEDQAARKKQWYKNYSFFDAPVGLIFYLHRGLNKGSWMDMGMFIQNVMLAARACGLESCPQAAIAEYPDIIREYLQISPEYHIACGMALGYADWSHPINQYRTSREAVSSFTVWHD